MNASGTSSMAFLDVLTCGFGGMLMLFLVLIAVQPDLGAEETKNQLAEPLAIVVEFEQGGLTQLTQLTKSAPEAGAWTLQTDQNQIQPTFVQLGPTFAIFIFEQPLPHSANLSLVGVASESRGSIRWGEGGNTIAKSEIDATAVKSGQLMLWPTPIRALSHRWEASE